MPKKPKKPKPPVPKEPILDESQLLQQLKLPLQVMNLRLLRHAAPAAVLDAFDRGAKREFVAELINSAFALNEQARAFLLLDNLIKMSETPEGSTHIHLTVEQAQKIVVDLVKSTEEYRGKVVELATQLSEMPHEIDIVN